MPNWRLMTREELSKSHNDMITAHNNEQKAAESECRDKYEVEACIKAYADLFKVRDDIWLQSHGFKGRLWAKQ